MAEGVSSRTVELATADGPMDCFEARPDEPAGRAVIVVQEAFGVNPYIKRVTERFAGAGFDAVAPSIFHRAGGGTAPYDDFAKVIPLYEGLTDDGILMDLDATFTHLATLGHAPAAAGVVGFCFGGRVTFLAAARRSFGAAVGFYGGGLVTPRFPQFPALVDETATLQTPWLGLFGDEDGSIPVADVETLRTALGSAPVDTEIVRYPGAEHGFFCDERPSFDAEASDDAWPRALAWFDRYLVRAG
ncbi:MAG: dienelactone hydrolase family protein [Acidimicrobiia bacterium]